MGGVVLHHHVLLRVAVLLAAAKLLLVLTAIDDKHPFPSFSSTLVLLTSLTATTPLPPGVALPRLDVHCSQPFHRLPPLLLPSLPASTSTLLPPPASPPPSLPLSSQRSSTSNNLTLTSKSTVYWPGWFLRPAPLTSHRTGISALLRASLHSDTSSSSTGISTSSSSTNVFL